MLLPTCSFSSICIPHRIPFAMHVYATVYALGPCDFNAYECMQVYQRRTYTFYPLEAKWKKRHKVFLREHESCQVFDGMDFDNCVEVL